MPIDKNVDRKARKDIADLQTRSVSHGESRQDFTATAGQTVFDLSFTYTPGAGELLVFVGGILQDASGFAETDSDTVTLSAGVPAGTSVRIFRL